jgi:hypothetical protein
MINDPTQPLMTIADLSTVWVTALVPEKDLGRCPGTRTPKSTSLLIRTGCYGARSCSSAT